jgi:transcriptional regulator with XRE-family HTH domain
MRSSDIVRIARQRAGLTQEQLAERSGHPRTTIVRWESGAREPTLATLEQVVAACELDLVVQLAQRDSSLDELVRDQLALSPLGRLQALVSGDDLDRVLNALYWIGDARTPVVVVGAIAAALQGAPQRPDGTAVEIVSSDAFATEAEMHATGITPVDAPERWASVDRREPWSLRQGGTIALARDLPGTSGFSDLRRAAEVVEVQGERLTVAHPRDLLRLADASPRDSERARAPGLRALLLQRRDRRERA